MTDNNLKPSSEAHRRWRNKNKERYLSYQRWYSKANSAKSVAATKEWRSLNRDRRCQSDAAWRANNARKAKGYQLKSKYGLSADDYDFLLMKQRGLCAICDGGTSGSGDLHVDHEHTTGKVRGLLCSRCNQAIGLLLDDPELLRRASEYLQV